MFCNFYSQTVLSCYVGCLIYLFISLFISLFTHVFICKVEHNLFEWPGQERALAPFHPAYTPDFCSFLQGLKFDLSLKILVFKKRFNPQIAKFTLFFSFFFVNIHLSHNVLFLIARALLKNLHSIFKIPNIDFSEKWLEDEAGFALVKDWHHNYRVALAAACVCVLCVCVFVCVYTLSTAGFFRLQDVCGILEMFGSTIFCCECC